MGVYKLQNTIQSYDWGDREWIPSLLEIDNSEDKPMAELWMGAHPSASSRVLVSDGEIPLTELIEKDPEGILGRKTVKRFGRALPFLFKVLAAGSPLSIQAHPNKKQAEAGFKRENKAGIPLDAYDRNYKDDNHKPEIISALTEFHAMRGFRPAREIKEEFTKLLSGFSHPFRLPDKESGLHAFFESVLSAPEESIARTIDHVIQEIERRGEEDVLRYSWLKRLQEQYPGDIGVLCPLFLHVIVLQPGEGMYLPAGELHAYMHGLGIELMANSDNVLRGGCTSKHIAKEELLKVLRFESIEPDILNPEPDEEGEAVYPAGADEFRLSVITLLPEREYLEEECSKCVILICTEGTATVRPKRGSTVQMGKGNSVLITADTGYYTIDGRGTVYKATVGR